MSETKMTKEKGLAFLKAHQPMPDTMDLDIDYSELIDQWEEVREYFEENPCLEAIPLFLNSFGDSCGYNVYEFFYHNLKKFPPEQVVPYLVEALKSPLDHIRELAALFSTEIDSGDPSYIEALIGNLDDENEDTRSSVCMELAFLSEHNYFDWRMYEKRLRELAEQEKDDDILDDYKTIFES